ncbi:MAG: D-serine ammonia-lyase [Candidatus Pelethousia sp.]|nr:D-serine ammonia-lyase [Candidatus Pelethousia sp.]
MDIETLIAADPIVDKLARAKECLWLNPHLTAAEHAFKGISLTMADIDDADARLLRFAPFIEACFPETRPDGGLIESPLTEIERMRTLLNSRYGGKIGGRLLLKRDSDLPIAGSVKARGGIYEILKHSEELALCAGLLTVQDDYAKLAEPSFRAFFAKYTIQAGSTGNLGLSIGIMSAAIGYRVIVHMSADARQWKKDLLRSKGVEVIEYASDYSEAVRRGRALSDADPMSYFVDDENSVALFLGYAVAAKRLQAQLAAMKVPVDDGHPLFVYIPCGVGGAPGGIAFGLKQLFGDAVHIFFVEPVQAPCMVLGMATGLNNGIGVQDIGLTGRTHADGLAVGRPSGFVGKAMKHILSGGATLADPKLYDYMRDLLESEQIFIEPSACAAFEGPLKLCGLEGEPYRKARGLAELSGSATHVAWATGGRLVPEDIRAAYISTHLK